VLLFFQIFESAAY